MKIVTGGAGFVGRHLVARLARDDDVTVIDNHLTSEPTAGAPPAVPARPPVGAHANGNGASSHAAGNGTHPPATARPSAQSTRAQASRANAAGRDPRVHHLEHDVVASLPNVDADQVYHLASPASPFDYARLPIETLRTGAEGTRNVLEWARRHDATFLLASTSEVYGDPEVHPQPESYEGRVSLTGPRAVYDEAKRYAEALTYAYHRTYGLETRVARIFNTYGPGMRPKDGRVVSTFVHHALTGRPLPIHGDGTQTRSFCFVSDLVEGLTRLMQSAETRPVNLGNPEEVTIIDLARTVHRVIGRDTGIQHRPLPENDPTRRRPDTTRAREVLGWRPRVSLAEGLERYAASLRMEVPA